VQLCRRIFAVRRCGKTAVMPLAFQGFDVTSGGKKTRQNAQVIVSQLLSYKRQREPTPPAPFAKNQKHTTLR